MPLNNPPTGGGTGTGKGALQFFAGRNQNGINLSQDLKRDDGISTNDVPFEIPFNANLELVTMQADVNPGTWCASILQNGVSSGPLTFSTTMLSEVHTVSPTIAFAAGDKVRVRFLYQGASIDKPAVILYFSEV